MKNVLIVLILFNSLFAYTFPLKEPIKVNNKILCSAWYSFKRADMHGKQYGALNYPCREGAIIVSPGDGVIVATGYGRYSGIFIKVMVSNGDVFEFNHLSDWQVVKGQNVSEGDVIGFAGRTGRTTGSHIRIVLWKKGEKAFINASTWGMNYNDFVYKGGASLDELQFDFY